MKNDYPNHEEIAKKIEEVKKELTITHWFSHRTRLWKKLWNLQIKLESMQNTIS